jgi:hypothetical protein
VAVTSHSYNSIILCSSDCGNDSDFYCLLGLVVLGLTFFVFGRPRHRQENNTKVDLKNGT